MLLLQVLELVGLLFELAAQGLHFGLQRVEPVEELDRALAAALPLHLLLEALDALREAEPGLRRDGRREDGGGQRGHRPSRVTECRRAHHLAV